jgi:hypothetical protein
MDQQLSKRSGQSELTSSGVDDKNPSLRSKKICKKIKSKTTAVTGRGGL